MSVSEPSVTFCLSPGNKQFVCPLGDKQFSYTVWGGDKHFSHTDRGDKHFYIEGGDKYFCIEGRDKTIFVGGGIAYDDVDEEMVVSRANIFVSEALRALKF